jgi:hypothetical protein
MAFRRGHHIGRGEGRVCGLEHYVTVFATADAHPATGDPPKGKAGESFSAGRTLRSRHWRFPATAGWLRARGRSDG